ncbi:growth arrest-specific protein 1-like [Thrips palmi]|uniref:Growth arrest-specific protein 1-like n=1 Tax=Thrips palmi TaxID=161013 RepID=A0A6P8YTW6_THRPL|nr:growth arrest-specific protein 1-like [Thrips palmi]
MLAAALSGGQPPADRPRSPSSEWSSERSPPPGHPLLDVLDSNRDARRPPSCEEARLKCAYRTGCGRALQAYIVGCSSLHHGPPGHCPEACQQALIALTSTDEGKDLMTCQCADELCEETKRRVEVCRPAVVRATSNESAVSCRVAQLICGADALCSTALDYYHLHCRKMFLGHRCSKRCKNSISILRRQEKAAKLDSCWCDGREDYDCPAIRANMARLCFHQEPPRPPPDALPGDVDTNELLPKRDGGVTKMENGANFEDRSDLSLFVLECDQMYSNCFYKAVVCPTAVLCMYHNHRGIFV